MTLIVAPRDRRTLIIGALIIAGLLGLTHGVPAWRRWQHETYLRASTMTGDLARAEAHVRARSALADSLAARNARFLALAPALLAGETPASAGATLAGLVSGAAATTNVRLGAVDVRVDSARPGTFTHVAVAATATGDVRGLTHLLARLEAGPTLLAVRALTLTQPEPGAAADRMEILQVAFTVEGLVFTPPATGRRP
jgi:hypothetical protein